MDGIDPWMGRKGGWFDIKLDLAWAVRGIMDVGGWLVL